MAKSRSEIAAVVARYVECLRRQGIEVERAYLFGSYLRGTAHEYSDVDVVIVSRTLASRRPWEIPKITGRARGETFKATGESVEALAKTPEEVANAHPASFLADILKDAVVIYEAPEAAA